MSRLLLALALCACSPDDPSTGWNRPSDGLRATATPSGIEVGGVSTLRVSLDRWGRDGDLRVAPGAEPARSGGRISTSDPGISAWFADHPAGIEQGFTVHRSPEGEGPLVFDLRVEGARVEIDGRTARFVPEVGRPLTWTGLAAFDGAGRALPSRLAPIAGGVRIAVDDRGAVGTVVVDPFLSPVWAEEGTDNRSALFGTSVASAGDVNADGFDDLIVGAPGYDGLGYYTGKAAVYLGSAAGLELSPSWEVEGTQGYANVGASVASAGDVDGDGYDDVVVAGSLLVAVYLGSPAGLLDVPAWSIAPVGSAAVASADVDGDGYADVIVGEPYYANGGLSEGRVSVYLGGPGGLGALAAWAHESNQAGAQLGWAVSGGDPDGDGFAEVIAGARLYDGALTDEGAVFAWSGGAGGPSALPTWTVEGGQAGAQLGYAVGSAGDVDGDGLDDVIAGAPYWDGGEVDEGQALLFLGLSGTAAWTAESDVAGALFAQAVDVAGDVDGDGYAEVVVGKPEWTEAYLWRGAPGGPSGGAAWSADENTRGDWFGASVAGAGDVDGDGYADLAVGAPGNWITSSEDPDSGTQGWVFVYYGGLCTGDESTGDSDADGTCDDLDACAGDDEVFDPNHDGDCNDPDLCFGDDAIGDTDGDGTCDDRDLCAGDDESGDADADGVCRDQDPCFGADDVDSDADGVCDSLDVCADHDDKLDDDGDGVPDDCDPCPFANPDDADNDGACGDVDVCEGGDDAADPDVDGVPDACDDCDGVYDPEQGGLYAAEIQIPTLNTLNGGFALADLDADGDLDLAVAGYAGVGWHENAGTFGAVNLLESTIATRYTIEAADLDADGDTDLLVTDTIAGTSWFANLGGSFGPEAAISTDGATAATSADLDADGDRDVVSSAGGSLRWQENLGSGVFGAPVVLATGLTSAFTVRTADVDSDGDADVVTQSRNDVLVVENLGGAAFAASAVAATGMNYGGALRLADVDGDGDPDLLCTSSAYDVVWLPNTGGAFGAASIALPRVGPQLTYDAGAADLDGDGDLEVFALSGADGTTWVENQGGGVFSFGQSLGASGDDQIAAADLDGDGDPELVKLDPLAFFENTLPFPPDLDADGLCDADDADDDQDGVPDADDAAPLDPAVCGDANADGCDECAPPGPDLDADGLCDAGDPDDDADGVLDLDDPAPLDPALCGDANADGCDECAAPGPDLDADGLCDVGDPDDDADGVLDASDPAPLDPGVCGDANADGCDDCSPGPDLDTDGLCDAGDPDDDADGVLDASDPAPLDPGVCGDADADGCDDCDPACVPEPDPEPVDTGTAPEPEPEPADESGCAGCDAVGGPPLAGWTGLLAAGLLARRRGRPRP